MTGPIRLLVCDVDGTLVRSDKSLSEANVAAIAKLLTIGVRVSLMSARPPSGMLAIVKQLGLTAPQAAFNGGTIFTPDGTIMMAERLVAGVAARALDGLSRTGIEPWLFADGEWYARTTEGQHVPHERLSAGLEPTIRSDLTELLDRVDKLVGVCDNGETIADLETELATTLGAAATVQRSQIYYLDVTAPSANKGDGITAISAACGIPLSAVAAIGDQRNDVSMFKRASFSIAMAQAPTDVRSAANFVTRSNDDDGVAHAIEKLIADRAAA